MLFVVMLKLLQALILVGTPAHCMGIIVGNGDDVELQFDSESK